MSKEITSRGRYAVPVAVVVAALGIGSLWVSSKVFGTPTNVTLPSVWYFGIPIASALAMMFVLKQQDAFIGFASRIGAFFTKGWYLVFVALTLVTIFFLTAPDSHLTPPKMSSVVIFAAVALLTGFFEETLCRGTIQNLLVRHFGPSASGVRTGIIISSAVFALLHFVNLVDKPYLVLGTITQVIYAFCIGMFLGSIFHVTHDLLVPMLLHAFFNFCAGMPQVFAAHLGGLPQEDISLVAMAIQLVLLLPAAFLGLRILRSHASASTIV